MKKHLYRISEAALGRILAEAVNASYTRAIDSVPFYNTMQAIRRYVLDGVEPKAECWLDWRMWREAKERIDKSARLSEAARRRAALRRNLAKQTMSEDVVAVEVDRREKDAAEEISDKEHHSDMGVAPIPGVIEVPVTQVTEVAPEEMWPQMSLPVQSAPVMLNRRQRRLMEQDKKRAMRRALREKSRLGT